MGKEKLRPISQACGLRIVKRFQPAKALASIATAAQETFAEIQQVMLFGRSGWISFIIGNKDMKLRTLATKLSKIIKPRLGIQARCPCKKGILLKINEAVSVAKLQYE